MIRRLLRNPWFLFVLALLVALPVWWFADDALGERHWREYAAEARARGVKLTTDEMLPPQGFPDGENYAGSPFWKDVAAHPNDPGWAIPSLSPPSGRFTREDRNAFSPRRDLAGWRTSMISANWLPASDTQGSDPEAVLRGLQKAREPLAAIRLSTAKPHIYIPLAWSPDAQLQQPYLGAAIRLAKLVSLKCAAETALGRSQEALASWKDGIGLLRVVNTTPNLISGLIAHAIEYHSLVALKEGIAARIWNDTDLQEIQHLLSEQSPLGCYRDELNGERTCENALLENPKFRERLRLVIGKPLNFLGRLQLNHQRTWRELQIYLNRAMDEELGRLDADANVCRPLTNHIYGAKVVTRDTGSAWAAMVEAFLPSLNDLSQRATYQHARMRMAVLACALERFRLAHGKYPATLVDLVPEFTATLPVDPCGGSSFHYRLSEKSGYVIYSVGTDGQDDGGTGENLHHTKGDWWWDGPEPPKQSPQ